jgi:hypothetical protein
MALARESGREHKVDELDLGVPPERVSVTKTGWARTTEGFVSVEETKVGTEEEVVLAAVR